MTPTLKHTTYSQQNYSNYIKYYMLLNQEFSINGYMIDRSQSQNAKKKIAQERNNFMFSNIFYLIAHYTLYKPNNFINRTPSILM